MLIRQLTNLLEQQTTADIMLANCMHTIIHDLHSSVTNSSDAACRCSTSSGRMCDRCNNIDELHASNLYGNKQHMVLVTCLCICLHMFSLNHRYVSTETL